MKNIGLILAFVLNIIILGSCGETIPVQPEWSIQSIQTVNIRPEIKSLLNGVYETTFGSDIAGEKVILKFSTNYLSLYFSRDNYHAFLKGGIVDSNLYFYGYFRNVQSYDAFQYITLEIKAGQGAADLIRTGKLPENLVFEGAINSDPNKLNKSFSIRLKSPLKNDTGFMVVGHRCGGANDDCFTVPESSLEMARLSEAYGNVGIEFDPRLTKDGVLIVYHDDNFAPRLVNSEFCFGPVENYNFSHIRTFCKLKNGENIPTMREMLDVVLNETNIHLVWLDTKYPALINHLIPLQKEYNDKAKAKNRDLTIYIGLPTQESIDAYLEHPEHVNSPSICQLSIDNVKKTGAKIWSPRWTLGTMKGDIEQMHSLGVKTIFWTVNDHDVMDKILESGADGLLTDYPPIITYKYYAK